MRTVALIAMLLAGLGTASAEGLAGMEKTILPAIKANWIAFRNYDGRQYVYFTMLLAYRCGLKAVRFGVNGASMDEAFPLPPCDPDNPNAIDAEKYPPYITMPLGAAETMGVQIIYADGEKSAVVTFRPCQGGPPDATCAALVE